MASWGGRVRRNQEGHDSGTGACDGRIFGTSCPFIWTDGAGGWRLIGAGRRSGLDTYRRRTREPGPRSDWHVLHGHPAGVAGEGSAPDGYPREWTSRRSRAQKNGPWQAAAAAGLPLKADSELAFVNLSGASLGIWRAPDPYDPRAARWKRRYPSWAGKYLGHQGWRPQVPSGQVRRAGS
jgi:hypothetical protein